MKAKMILTTALTFITMSVFAQNNDGRIPAKGFAVFEERGHFQPYNFSRHAVGDNDIQIDILYAGICHSDFTCLLIGVRRNTRWFPVTK